MLLVLIYDKTNNKSIACDTSNAKSFKQIAEGKTKPAIKLMNHRMVEVERHLCRSSGPTHLLKQGHLNHVAQDG